MIIITGASRNIGKYLFERYYGVVDVIGTYNTTKPIEKYKDNIIYKVDVCDYESINHFYEDIKSRISCLTLINCAGISYNSYAHKSDPNEWKKVIETNLIGLYYVIRVFLPKMRDQNYGRIINISSVAAQKCTPGISAYAASKSGLWGMTKSICIENGSKNITINNINLGYVRIGMGVEDVPEKYQEYIKKQIPSNDFCDEKDIYNTIEYIRNTKYLNGSSIDLNGGLI
ncbi:SDR family NAD(P)-dependent oxidoreductase [Prosthecochloris sp. SCSIO W1103]|uniref:SDR family NAD(P)-dependent oxidoreductase n=1 Tax=Prosthecochloris sp. SCSIO W1103 TaxID=2992244 RepID=UPI00223CEDD2|nr:SDR family NAD(P)-dependent oxidoreductase [Prosthecochloris sp. SCSIO W1103]UZJ38152.1 SDR family NAD(P)-dependent oxidoreductase [Prosthecochloris sp. SCSIO W1103]